MRKFVFLVVVSACCALTDYSNAQAQQIVGSWLGTGVSSLGGNYAAFMRFFGNGGIQFQLAVSASPQMPQGSGVTNCQGNYQFNGQILTIRYSACDRPIGVSMTQGGPIYFQGPNVFTWGDTTFERQSYDTRRKRP
jgi:hypothetical protein